MEQNFTRTSSPSFARPTSTTPNPAPLPVPVPEQTLDFCEALRGAARGKMIHKLAWNDRGFYGVFKDETLMLHKPDGQFYQWIISISDLLGSDYVFI